MPKKISLIILVIIVAVVCFYAGVKYQGGKTLDLEAMMLARVNQGQSAGDHTKVTRTGRFDAMAGGGFTSGKIISKDYQSITVELMDADGQAGSKIIFFSEATDISKTAEGEAEDLSVDTQIIVIGTENADGSITAQTIQIRPMMQRMGDAPVH